MSTLSSRVDPDLITAAAACRMLGIQPYALQRMVINGHLKPVMLRGQLPRYRRSQVEALAAETDRSASK